MGFGNRIAMAILRSPLHRMMSKSLLTLDYTGRRSGKAYELPLQYVEHGGVIYIWAGNSDTKTWWRNFETPAVVTVMVRGREVAAKASLLDDVERRAEVLGEYIGRYPYTTSSGRPKFIGKRWQPDGTELAAVAEGTVLVALEPQ